MANIFYVKCAWCGKEIGRKDNLDAAGDSVSHGICRECVQRHFSSLAEKNVRCVSYEMADSEKYYEMLKEKLAANRFALDLIDRIDDIKDTYERHKYTKDAVEIINYLLKTRIAV